MLVMWLGQTNFLSTSIGMVLSVKLKGNLFTQEYEEGYIVRVCIPYNYTVVYNS